MLGMERIKASIGRQAIFSFLLTVVIFLLMHNVLLIANSHHKPVLAQKMLPTATPTATETPTPTPLPTDTPIPTSVPTPSSSGLTGVQSGSTSNNPTDDVVWEKLADCESHQNWADDTGNGYFGGLQFSQSAWESVGGAGKPSSASREEQISRGKLLQQQRGWAAWGACSRELGLD